MLGPFVCIWTFPLPVNYIVFNLLWVNVTLTNLSNLMPHKLGNLTTWLSLSVTSTFNLINMKF